MKGRRLDALAELTDACARRERERLEQARAVHRRLERQRQELGEHARRYQREALADERETPVPLLLQRRAFVARLVERVVALGEETRRSESRVREASSASHTATARDLALAALRRRVATDESITEARAERALTDEAARRRERAAVLPILSTSVGERS